MNREILEKLLLAQAQRRAVAVITDLTSGQQRIVARDAAASDELAEALDKGFRFDQSGTHATPAGEAFVHIHNPPLRVILIGAVHIGQSLIPMAQAAGYDVIVIDPRGAFATAARFPDVALHPEWPDEIIPRIGLDARTAVIALTHDPKIDDPALTAAVRSPVFYIGALGSKKTSASRIERLAERGVERNLLARINGPIGLDIGAKGPAEIAISIMAQMTRALRLGT